MVYFVNCRRIEISVTDVNCGYDTVSVLRTERLIYLEPLVINRLIIAYRCERDTDVHVQPLPQVTGVDKNNLYKVSSLNGFFTTIM